MRVVPTTLSSFALGAIIDDFAPFNRFLCRLTILGCRLFPIIVAIIVVIIVVVVVFILWARRIFGKMVFATAFETLAFATIALAASITTTTFAVSIAIMIAKCRLCQLDNCRHCNLWWVFLNRLVLNRFLVLVLVLVLASSRSCTEQTTTYCL